MNGFILSDQAFKQRLSVFGLETNDRTSYCI